MGMRLLRSNTTRGYWGGRDLAGVTTSRVKVSTGDDRHQAHRTSASVGTTTGVGRACQAEEGTDLGVHLWVWVPAARCQCGLDSTAVRDRAGMEQQAKTEDEGQAEIKPPEQVTRGTRRRLRLIDKSSVTNSTLPLLDLVVSTLLSLRFLST